MTAIQVLLRARLKQRFVPAERHHEKLPDRLHPAKQPVRALLLQSVEARQLRLLPATARAAVSARSRGETESNLAIESHDQLQQTQVQGYPLDLDLAPTAAGQGRKTLQRSVEI